MTQEELEEAKKEKDLILAYREKNKRCIFCVYFRPGTCCCSVKHIDTGRGKKAKRCEFYKPTDKLL